MNTHTSRFPRTEAHVVAALAFQSLNHPKAPAASSKFQRRPAEGGNEGPLTDIEAGALARCERTIRAGLKTFVEVGAALMEIRDDKLYRATHATWEEYCRSTWGFTARYATYQIESSAVVKQLKASAALLPERAGQSPKRGYNPDRFLKEQREEMVKARLLPASESQARPLTRLPTEDRAPAWQEAVESANGKPTAKHVEEVVRKREIQSTARAGGLRYRVEDEPWKSDDGLSEKLSVIGDVLARLRRLSKLLIGDKQCRDYCSSAMGSLQAVERKLMKAPSQPATARHPGPARDKLTDTLKVRWAKAKAAGRRRQ